jgi:hypothetical protein
MFAFLPTIQLIKRKITFGLLTHCECLANARVDNAIHTKTDRAVDTCQCAIVSKGVIDFG